MGQGPIACKKLVGFTTFGMAVPAIRGAEDPPNQQNPDPNVQQQPDPNAQNPQGTPPDTSAADPNTSGASTTVSREEYDALMRRMQAADKNRSTAENRLKEIDDAAKTELEKAESRAKEAEARAEAAEKLLQDTRIETEFLKDNKYAWHDNGDALRLLDREGIEVAEDGTVKGVKEAAAALAKAKPFMLKDKPVEPKEEGKSGNAAGATGSNPTPPNNSNDRNSDRERLSKKFPALGRR